MNEASIMPINLVVFDLGRVLINWDPVRTQAGHLTSDQWHEFTCRTNFYRYNDRLDSGELIGDVRQDFLRDHPCDIDIFDRYVFGFGSSISGEVLGMRDLIQDLKNMGIRVAGLSNWPAELYHHATATVDIVDELEDVIVSGHVMMRKPELRIYKLMIDRLHAVPGKTIFIDDKQENVEAARMIGLHALTFTDTVSTRQQLRELIPTLVDHHQ